MRFTTTVLLCALLTLSSGCALVPDFYTPDMEAHTDTERGIEAFNTADYPKALKYMGPLADDGDPDAQYIVGMIYLYGLAGVKNTYTAQKFLTFAAQQGQRAAQEQLAFLYQDDLTPVYNPIDAYYWFSVIIGDHPQYRSKLENLEWTLRSRGLLEQARSMSKPIEPRYKGIDYNSLFPLR